MDGKTSFFLLRDHFPYRFFAFFKIFLQVKFVMPESNDNTHHSSEFCFSCLSRKNVFSFRTKHLFIFRLCDKYD